ncbi:CLUMA_CG006620, isoform A [Clunio marinus]|uniref:CLUMA_CG006620, isoform A n=1 Tax=Clunio marinus TaxID=568069 RepID=A0A1J1HYP4_9DIPT|nr:CLUMA_CG006620, isoform A [Clunio marinus]
MAGVLCTLSLLNAHLKDFSGEIKDPSTLSNLYASSLTKFLNYAAAFQANEATMYRSAKKLGIESFLIDLRHLCAHGKQQVSLEVFRRSLQYCFEWIRKFYWEKEIKNISDAVAEDVCYDSVLVEKLKELFPVYDAFTKLAHNKIFSFGDASVDDLDQDQWSAINKFKNGHNFNSVLQGHNIVTLKLSKIIESSRMRLSPKTFFNEMFKWCRFLLRFNEPLDNRTDENDGSEEESSPTKRRKRDSNTIVNLFQPLIWHLAKNDFLNEFIHHLNHISINEKDDISKRKSAQLWLMVIFESFTYYQNYCKFTNNNGIWEKKITNDVRNIYSYQLDADLKKVFIFVGTQMLPSSLKYSRSFFTNILNNVDKENEDICFSLLPFIYPPLSSEQTEKIIALIKIKTTDIRSKKISSENIFTVEDLFSSSVSKADKDSTEIKDNIIWEKSSDNIEWSTHPIGGEFLAF